MRRLARNGTRSTPVILGAYANGLGLARALGEGNLVSIVVSDRPAPALYSRHAVSRLMANPRSQPAAFGQALLGLAGELTHGGVVFATSDEYLKALAPIRPDLEAAGLICLMSPTETLDVFGSKRKTHALARQLGIAVPHSVDLVGSAVEKAVAHMRLPAILKPEETVGFTAAIGMNRQTIMLETRAQAKDVQVQLAAAGLGDRAFVLQEFIPGPARRLYTISTFSDRIGRIHAYSTGHKVRQFPPEAGTISRGYVVPTPALLEPTARLFSALSFFGVANTEYKFDERDGRFKLIEVNPRPGKWNASATRTGVNLPLLAYRYATEGVLPPSLVTSPERAVWTESWLNQLLGMTAEFGLLGALRRTVAPDERLPGKRIPAVFEWRDPLPGFWELRQMAAAVPRFIRTRFLGR